MTEYGSQVYIPNYLCNVSTKPCPIYMVISHQKTLSDFHNRVTIFPDVVLENLLWTATTILKLLLSWYLICLVVSYLCLLIVRVYSQVFGIVILSIILTNTIPMHQPSKLLFLTHLFTNKSLKIYRIYVHTTWYDYIVIFTTYIQK